MSENKNQSRKPLIVVLTLLQMKKLVKKQRFGDPHQKLVRFVRTQLKFKFTPTSVPENIMGKQLSISPTVTETKRLSNNAVLLEYTPKAAF